MAIAKKAASRTLILGIFVVANLFSFISAKPGFTELLFNPHWYRTYDSTSDIIPTQGELLFAWNYADAAKHPDSFFVGIDTLWSLPQDVNGDTAEDWDLQVCPDGFCMNGLKAGIHGANAPDSFGVDKFSTEHHFQFFPAVSPSTFSFVAPPKSFFGGMMYVRSRSTGEADTVLGFGAWQLHWDSAFIPPVRPNGYLPKRSDFVISGDTIRYIKGAVGGVLPRPSRGNVNVTSPRIVPNGDGYAFLFPSAIGQKEVRVFGPDGKLLWSSGHLRSSVSRVDWVIPQSSGETRLFVRITWIDGSAAFPLPPRLLSH